MNIIRDERKNLVTSGFLRESKYVFEELTLYRPTHMRMNRLDQIVHSRLSLDLVGGITRKRHRSEITRKGLTDTNQGTCDVIWIQDNGSAVAGEEVAAETSSENLEWKVKENVVWIIE